MLHHPPAAAQVPTCMMHAHGEGATTTSTTMCRMLMHSVFTYA